MTSYQHPAFSFDIVGCTSSLSVSNAGNGLKSSLSPSTITPSAKIPYAHAQWCPVRSLSHIASVLQYRHIVVIKSSPCFFPLWKHWGVPGWHQPLIIQVCDWVLCDADSDVWEWKLDIDWGTEWQAGSLSGGAGGKGAEVAKTSLQHCCHYCFGDANHEKQIVGDKVGFSAASDGE